MGGTIAIGVFSLFMNFVQLDVPCYDQTLRYQSACESVATVECLNALGYDISVDDFLDRYLDTIATWAIGSVAVDDNIFNHYFVGNPRTYNGWLCYPPVIVNAVQRYFSDVNMNLRRPVDYTGVGFNFLLDELALGNPVVIWVTQNYEVTEYASLYGNQYAVLNHAVVLAGYDRSRGVVSIIDSINGVLELDYNRVKSVFDFAGKRSVVIK